MVELFAAESRNGRLFQHGLLANGSDKVNKMGIKFEQFLLLRDSEHEHGCWQSWLHKGPVPREATALTGGMLFAAYVACEHMP